VTVPEEHPANAEPGAAQPARGAVQILVANVVLLVSGFGVSVILARGLGPEAFGVYGVVMSVMVWLERLISAGVPGATAAMLLSGAQPHAVVTGSARVLMLLFALPLFVLLWVLAPALADYLGIPAGATLIRIAACNLPAMAIYYAYDAIFNGRRMFWAQSALQIVQSIAKLVGVLLLLIVGLSLPGVYVAHVTATIVTIGLATIRFRSGGGRASAAVMREMSRIALPMGVYALAFSVLMNLSLWQLQAGEGQDPQDVGYFVAAINLTRIMMMVPATVSGVLFASLAWARSTGQAELVTKYLQEAMRFALIVTVPACVLIGVDADGVMGLLFGQQYVAGAGILALLCVAFALIALIDVLFHALMADGGFLRSAAVLAGLVPVLYVLNALWIPAGGGAGAAMGSTVAMAIGVVVAAVIVRVRLGSSTRVKTLLRVCGSGLVTGLLATQIPADGFWLLVKLGGLSVLYLGLLWVTGEVSVHDLKPFAIWRNKKA